MHYLLQRWNHTHTNRFQPRVHQVLPKQDSRRNTKPNGHGTIQQTKRRKNTEGFTETSEKRRIPRSKRRKTTIEESMEHHNHRTHRHNNNDSPSNHEKHGTHKLLKGDKKNGQHLWNKTNGAGTLEIPRSSKHRIHPW